MSKSLDDAWIDLRMRMREFDQLLEGTELPDGVFMHSTTHRVENRFRDLLSQASLEIMDAAAVVKKIGKPKQDD